MKQQSVLTSTCQSDKEIVFPRSVLILLSLVNCDLVGFWVRGQCCGHSPRRGLSHTLNHDYL